MDARRINRHSAVAGTVVWIGWQVLTDVFEPAALLAISPLVLIPLLLAAVAEREAERSRLMRALSYSQLACALPLPLALNLGPSAFALLACLPWVGWTVMAALEGARRLLAMIRESGVRGLWDAELAIAAGLGFPVVGSFWLVCDRLGLEPMGFSPLIVLLTATHFVHAGPTLPLSAGLLGRVFERREPWRTAAVATVVAVPMVALGISFSPVLELIGGVLTAAAGIVVGVGLLRRSTDLPLVSGLLSALAGACLLAAMVLASSYALGEFGGTPWPDISAMIRLHGAVNALGFGLLGAWAWHISPPTTHAKASGADA